MRRRNSEPWRRRSPFHGALLLLLIALVSLPPPSCGDRAVGRRPYRNRKVAKCLQRKYREAQNYVKCAWPLSRVANKEGNGSAEGVVKRGKSTKKGGKTGDDPSAENKRKQRLKACSSNIDDSGRIRSRCMDKRTSAASVDKIVELCREGGITFKPCMKWARRFVNFSAGRRIGRNAGKEKTTTTTTASAAENAASDEALFMVSGRQSIIPWRTSDFDASVVDGYTNCGEFEADIEQALLMLADSVIRQNLKDYENRRKRGGGVFEVFYSEPMALEDTADEGATQGAQEEEESSFDTNTQEEGVDEGDAVKVRKDGSLAFAAYGNLILAWDTVTGEIRGRTKVEAIESLDGQPKVSGCYYGGGNRATVQSLLIDDDRLVAIVETGYRGCWCWYCFYSVAEGDDEGNTPREESILSDHAAVQIRIYDISDDAMPDPDSFVLNDTDPTNIEYDLAAMELTVLDSANLQGRLVSARSIGSTGHVVTQSDVRHWLFTDMLNYWNEAYMDFNATEYAEAAGAKALEFAPRFARKLSEEILGEGGVCTDNFVRLSSFGMPSSSDEMDESGGDAADRLLGQSGLINTFMRVNSFDFNLPGSSATGGAAVPFAPAVAGFFLPTYYAEMYASADYLVLGGRLYSRFGNWPSDWWEDYTYLLSFKLSSDGSAARAVAAGTVPGYTLDHFAFDEYEGYLRVATSTNARTECATFENYTYTSWSGDNFTYTYCSEWTTISNSTSQVTVLRLPDEGSGSGEMEFVSQIAGLGETERIFAVRFFDERAFVVTFQLTDPLYSIDFSNASHPVLADELKVSGFSRYLHPIGNDLLLSVGQEADEKTGRQKGLQISLYDVSDLYDISLVTRYTLEESDDAYSFSDAEFDHQAFRYLEASGWLLLPAATWDDKNPEKSFDGFLVFDVKRQNITQLFNVSMADEEAFRGDGCYYYASMPSRTLVFKGNATFIKRHSYQSWDISEEQFRWSKSFDFYLEEEECEPYWYFSPRIIEG